jgi:hypothetical protein
VPIITRLEGQNKRSCKKRPEGPRLMHADCLQSRKGKWIIFTRAIKKVFEFRREG